jgi:hypothetical protein
MARELVKLERQFTVELNNAVLPCGEKISLAKYISHYDRTRLMMQTKGFAEFIPLSNCEYVARMIDAYNKIRG